MKFAAKAPPPLVGSAPGGIAIRDFDGGGKQDIVVANINSMSIGMLCRNGDGTFEDNVWSLAVDDFNNDGKPDVAAALSNGVAVLRNDGAGKLLTAQIKT